MVMEVQRLVESTVETPPCSSAPSRRNEMMPLEVHEVKQLKAMLQKIEARLETQIEAWQNETAVDIMSCIKADV